MHYCQDIIGNDGMWAPCPMKDLHRLKSFSRADDYNPLKIFDYFPTQPFPTQLFDDI
jgi:hypothetical protein